MHPKTEGILESSLYVDDVAGSARFYEMIFGFRVISDFGEYEVRYAFLHVSERHPYMLFDTSQKGVTDFETHRANDRNRNMP